MKQQKIKKSLQTKKISKPVPTKGWGTKVSLPSSDKKPQPEPEEKINLLPIILIGTVAITGVFFLRNN